MELVTHRISLDTLRNGVQRVLQGFQTGDEYSRQIEISLVSGSVSYELPLDNITAVMYVTVPGALEPSINACEIDGNKIVYAIQPEDIAIEGSVSMQLKVIETRANGAEKVLVSPRFDLEVWESDVSDSGAEASTTFTALENAIAQAREMYNKTIAHIYLDDDNMFTVEYKDGTTYVSSVIADALSQIADIEGYVARAEQAAVVATAAELNVLDAEANAKVSEQNAAASENNAATSETNAAASEANAIAAENNATTAAATASTAASNASASEINAKSSETASKASETNAAASEVTASAAATTAVNAAANIVAHETNAHDYSIASQSYAVGGTGTRTNEDNDNAKYYKEQCEQIAGGLQGGFIPMGTVTFASLATLNPNAGYMYNVSDEFTTDSRFKDGAGKTYAAGTNVYWTADGKWDCLSGAVPTVNGKNGNSITLDGRDLLVTGYSKASAEAAIAATDSINVALGKLEKKADEVPNKVAAVDNKLSNYLLKSNIKSSLGTGATDAPVSAAVVDSLNTTLGQVATAAANAATAASSADTKATDAAAKAAANEVAITAINSNFIVNEFVFTTDMWAEDSAHTYADYPYVATYVTNKYSDDYVPLNITPLPMNGAVYTEEEFSAFASTNLSCADLGTHGFRVWIKEVPEVSIKFRIMGEG